MHIYIVSTSVLHGLTNNTHLKFEMKILGKKSIKIQTNNSFLF